MSYKLTKLKINTSSSLEEGSSCNGSLILFRDSIITDANLEDIQIDDMVLVDGLRFIKTSPVVEISEKTNSYLIFNTKTSTYKIERLYDNVQ